MKNLEKKFESTENLDDIMKLEFTGLLNEVASNKGVLDVIKKELKMNPGHMSDTTACLLTSYLDKEENLNKLSPEDRLVAKSITDGGVRGEVLAENYNENYEDWQEKTDNLIENLC